MTERVLNLVTYIQWEKPRVIEYDKIFNGLKALFEILSIYSYIIKGCYFLVWNIMIMLCALFGDINSVCHAAILVVCCQNVSP